jgi:hypothetical protein
MIHSMAFEYLRKHGPTSTSLVRIRDSIHGHIGMVELVNALLCCIGLGVCPKTPTLTLLCTHFTFTCLHLVVVCCLGIPSLLSQTEHYHYTSHIVTYSLHPLFPIIISSIIAKVTHLTHYLEIEEPSILVGTTTPSHKLPYPIL